MGTYRVEFGPTGGGRSPRHRLNDAERTFARMTAFASHAIVHPVVLN